MRISSPFLHFHDPNHFTTRSLPVRVLTSRTTTTYFVKQHLCRRVLNPCNFHGGGLRSFSKPISAVGSGDINFKLEVKGRLQLDPFLNELNSMFERSTEKGSVWVTLKRSSDKSKVQRNKMTTAGEAIEYKCLVRASDGKKTISTLVGAKDHQRFQASYATILKARMTALKKRERKDKRKAMEVDKKQQGSKKRFY